MVIGSHPKWLRALELAQRVAVEPLNCVLLGETGAGKEGFAALIHETSGRKGALVPVNCATLTPALIDAELFGYEKGAFTGAANARQGLFHAAHGGTLFLDEVGDLPIDVQPRVLRALQDGCIRRVGGLVEERVDVRIVAATHQPVWRMVEEGRFRRDLLERLAEAEIHVPPLRERGADVLELAEYFCATDPVLRGRINLNASARAALVQHSWPGNVRELKRLLRRAVLSGQTLIDSTDLGLDAERDTRAIQARVLELAHMGPVTAKQLEKELGLHRRHAQRVLQMMAQAGLLTVEKSRKVAHYQLDGMSNA